LKIAILGWGSLIWDEHPEFDNTHEGWLPGGPSLKLEFSRVSETRLGALTLVIDERHGEECVVKYCFSRRSSIDDAVGDLRSREGTSLKRIGYFAPINGQLGAPEVPHTIKAWSEGQKLDAVVWTGLQSNFEVETGQEFSVPNAINHLQGLSDEGKAMAAEYVWRAPDLVATPLRRALELEPWFCAKDRLGS
jgi:hypothetical protein